MSVFTCFGGITVLKTSSMSDSDLKVSVDTARQSDKAQLEYEEVTFTDITDDAVLSISICPEQFCGKILKNNTTLKRHMRGKHAQIGATKSETFNLDGLALATTPTCEYCGKHFTRKSNMKLHMKKCAGTMTQGEDENGGGREENPSGENNLGSWDENEKGSHKIEDDLFSSVFEPEVKYDMATHRVNDGDIHEGAETGEGDVEVKEDRDEIDGDEDEEDGDEDGGVGDEKEGEK